MQNCTIFEAEGGNEAVICKKKKIDHFDGYSNAYKKWLRISLEIRIRGRK
jgi:hypothetical protein